LQAAAALIEGNFPSTGVCVRGICPCIPIKYKMASARQDMPPPGGYPFIKFRRNLPNYGLTGLGTYLVVGGGMALALYIYKVRAEKIK